jgi:hypothetical protein
MKLFAATLARLCFSALADADQGGSRPAPKPSPAVQEITPQLYANATSSSRAKPKDEWRPLIHEQDT